MTTIGHIDTVGVISAAVEISHGACRSLPHFTGIATLTPRDPADRPAAGHYRSTLAPLLSMAERRLADRAHPEIVERIAEAIVRRQRSAERAPVDWRDRLLADVWAGKEQG